MKSESVVKEESSRPRKKKAHKESSVSGETLAAGSDGYGMTKQQIERAFKDISDAISDGFGTCFREIKLLGDRMVAVEKKVGITKKGGSSNDRQLTTTSNPPKPVHEPGSESVNEAKAGYKEAK
ncbi:BnaC09g25960D [Brassica napus]|uniref:BnaC09g25960D protein n=1 Tax=Brassica napus TaxID=3708 RepID=A0A078HU34_BRANA|nr:BnaC09g25960D [Brassica napus]